MIDVNGCPTRSSDRTCDAAIVAEFSNIDNTCLLAEGTGGGEDERQLPHLRGPLASAESSCFKPQTSNALNPSYNPDATYIGWLLFMHHCGAPWRACMHPLHAYGW